MKTGYIYLENDWSFGLVHVVSYFCTISCHSTQPNDKFGFMEMFFQHTEQFPNDEQFISSSPVF